MLATTGLLKGGGLEESHDFCLLSVDLHTISNAPFLADIQHAIGLQLAWALAGGHEREVINVKLPTNPDLRCPIVL